MGAPYYWVLLRLERRFPTEYAAPPSGHYTIWKGGWRKPFKRSLRDCNNNKRLNKTLRFVWQWWGRKKMLQCSLRAFDEKVWETQGWNSETGESMKIPPTSFCRLHAVIFAQWDSNFCSQCGVKVVLHTIRLLFVLERTPNGCSSMALFHVWVTVCKKRRNFKDKITLASS